MRTQIENGSIEMSRREDLALDMVATLDRAAQAATDPAARRRRWAQAVELLDWFLKQNPDAAPRAADSVSSGCLSLGDRAEAGRCPVACDPGDPQAAPGGHASSRRCDRAVSNNRCAAETTRRWPRTSAFAWPRRWPAAPSSSRRARPAGDRANPRPCRLLERPPSEAGLAGYWHLLKADLLRRSGKPVDAEAELDAAVKATPLRRTAKSSRCACRSYSTGRSLPRPSRAVEASRLDGPAKALWAARARLAQLAGLPAGTERFAAETDLFRRIERAAEGDVARIAAGTPGAGQSRDHTRSPSIRRRSGTRWRRPPRRPAIRRSAAAQMATAAQGAAALGQSDDAATYRLRGGGFLFQAGKLMEASALLAQVAEDPAPAPIRAKAGMLRVLAWAARWPWDCPARRRSSYTAALERQLRDFPGDPSTGEARWLLGRLAAASSERRSGPSLVVSHHRRVRPLARFPAGH